MKKRTKSIFLAIFALFAFQGAMAQSDNVVYEQAFDSQEAVNAWTVEGDISADYIKSFNDWKGATELMMDAAPYNGDKNVGYVVSPVFKLGDGENVAVINHRKYGFEGIDISELAKFVVREKGSTTWTELQIPTYPTDFSYVSSGDIIIPAEFSGKEVQVAFKSISAKENSDKSQIWYVKDIKVTAKASGGQQGEVVELWNDPNMGNAGYTKEGTDNIWNFPEGVLTAQAMSGENIESYYITPTISLGTDNTIEIHHSCKWFTDKTKQVAICVREVGGQWIKIEGLQYGDESLMVSSGVLNVPAEMNNKDVQFGLKYQAANFAEAGVWAIQDMLIKGTTVAKKDAELSFSVQEMAYELGSSEPFVEPTLNNPEKLVVHFYSDNETIAMVNPETGKVTFKGAVGVVEISAVADETNDFNAAKASYTITVTDPVTIFRADFMEDACGFTEEGDKPLWQYAYGCMAAIYNSSVEANKAAYLVSPEMTLNTNGNVVSFDQRIENMEKPAEIAKMAVREIGKEWVEIPITNYAEGFDYKNTGEIAVPAEFNGKKVQFALVYVNTENARWYVKNFVVALAVERAEAGISFEKNECTYYIGCGEDFVAPKLNNPNNVEVFYTTPENNGVAEVNAKTGEVKILKAGETTIVAKSLQNNSFKAGEAKYVLKVIDNTIVFEAPFGGKMNGFVEEGDGNYWSADGTSNTSLWIAPENAPAEGTKVYLVSPKMTLGKSGNNVSWEHNGYLIDLAAQTKLAVRKVGGEWEEFEVKNEAEAKGGFFATLPINIPETYNAQEVEMALVYISSGKECGWNLKNFVVRKAYEPAAKEAGLAFDKEAVEYDMSSDMLFEAPVLSNPNNLAVSYSSSNAEVATVNELTGEVTFVNKGVTVIKATSAATDEFLAGEASYTLTVKMTPTGIEAVIGENLENAKIYDLQGRRVNKVEKGVYIINGKKVVIK